MGEFGLPGNHFLRQAKLTLEASLQLSSSAGRFSKLFRIIEMRFGYPRPFRIPLPFPTPPAQ